MYQTSLCKWLVEQEFEEIAKRQTLQEIVESHDRKCHIEEDFIMYLSVDTNYKINENLLLVDEACWTFFFFFNLSWSSLWDGI